MMEKRCSSCGHQLSSAEKVCPECGRPIPAGATTRRRDHIIVMATLILAAAVYFGSLLIKPNRSADHPETEVASAAVQDDMDAFISKLPTDFTALVDMGNALMDRGEFHRAIACYQKALALDSLAVDVRVDLGTCQHNLQDYDQAIASFTRALAIDSGHQIAKFNLGIVYFTMGDSTVAGDWWRRLLAENPPEELRARTEQLLSHLSRPR